MVRKLLLTGLTVLLTVALGAQTVEDPESEDINLYREIRGLTEAGPPAFVQGHLLFTYRAGESERRSRFTRMVGIAFAHEQFSQVYAFKRLSLTEYAAEDLFYYVMPVPDGREELVYRLVVDGVWGKDPENSNSRVLPGGLQASRVEIPNRYQAEPEYPLTGEGSATFRLDLDEPGTPFLTTPRDERIPRSEFQGDTVYVAGSFNNWDPFMNPLEPVPGEPGRYRATIALPRGTHYYYFVVDGVRVLDPENRDRGYNPRSRSRSSRILVGNYP